MIKTSMPRPQRAWARLAAAFLCGPLLGAAAAPGAGGHRLAVHVRDAAPDSRPSFHRGRDNSYTVSTGGGGDRDDRLDERPDNGYVVGVHGAERVVHLAEGEAVRVDLPGLQSIQFHLPLSAASAHGPGAAAKPAASSAAPVSATGSSAAGAAGSAGESAPSAAGVVYFDSVRACVARFYLDGAKVEIRLKPLRGGTLGAPHAPAGPADAAEVRLHGALGAWIALGDDEVAPAKSLNATALPATPASVWVRVVREEDDQE